MTQFLQDLINQNAITQADSIKLKRSILRHNKQFELTVMHHNFKNSQLSDKEKAELYAKSFAREFSYKSKKFIYSERLLKTDLKSIHDNQPITKKLTKVKVIDVETPIKPDIRPNPVDFEMPADIPMPEIAEPKLSVFTITADTSKDVKTQFKEAPEVQTPKPNTKALPKHKDDFDMDW